MRDWVALLLVGASVGCGKTCPATRDVHFVDVTTDGAPWSMRESMRTLTRFWEWTGDDGLCLDTIEVVEDDDVRLDGLNGRYDAFNRVILLSRDTINVPLLATHELCHAYDTTHKVSKRNRKLFQWNDSLSNSRGYRNRFEAFAQWCEEGPDTLDLKRRLDQECNTDLYTPEQRWVRENVYGTVESWVSDEVHPLDRAFVWDTVTELADPEAETSQYVGSPDGLVWMYAGDEVVLGPLVYVAVLDLETGERLAEQVVPQDELDALDWSLIPGGDGVFLSELSSAETWIVDTTTAELLPTWVRHPSAEASVGAENDARIVAAVPESAPARVVYRDEGEATRMLDLDWLESVPESVRVEPTADGVALLARDRTARLDNGSEEWAVEWMPRNVRARDLAVSPDGTEVLRYAFSPLNPVGYDTIRGWLIRRPGEERWSLPDDPCNGPRGQPEAVGEQFVEIRNDQAIVWRPG